MRKRDDRAAGSLRPANNKNTKAKLLRTRQPHAIYMACGGWARYAQLAVALMWGVRV